MAIAVAILATLILASTALASGLNVGIGSATLSKSRVAVSVPVSVTCAALDPSFDLVIESVTVTIEESAGKQIARGTGSLNSGSPDVPLFGCDGTAKTVVVTVLADPTGPPFHGGLASVSANVQLMAGVQTCGPGCGSITYYASGSAGPVDRRI